MNDCKTVLLTGGTSGIGLATARGFAARGWRVYELSRREAGSIGAVTHIRADLAEPSSLVAAVERVLAETGRIDLLVNNAGIGIFGLAETTSMVEIRRQFEVNFFGTIALTQRVLAHFRANRRGRIINVASLAAYFPLPYQSFYSATKAALVAWSRALSGEVAKDGIQVVCVCPGDVRTAFTAARKCEVATEGCAKALRAVERAEGNGQSPEVVACKIVKVATMKHPPLVVIPGLGYAWLDRLARILPRGWVSALIAKFYTC